MIEEMFVTFVLITIASLFYFCVLCYRLCKARSGEFGRSVKLNLSELDALTLLAAGTQEGSVVIREALNDASVC